MTVNRAAGWSKLGNEIESGQVLGTLNAQDLIIITDGIERLRVDNFNTLAGGPALVIQEAVFLPPQIFLGNTMRIRAIENFIASEMKFELNNDQGGNIRFVTFSTSEAGFGSYNLQLGNGATNNKFAVNGAFDFDFEHNIADQKVNFILNDGGVPTTMMVLDPNDPEFNEPLVSVKTKMSILGGTIQYGVTPFNFLKIGGTVENVNDGGAENSTINSSVTWEYIVGFTGVFSSTQSINGSVILKPIGLGAGTDTHTLRGIFGSAFFEDAGGRTINQTQGIFGNSGSRGTGTVALATGVAGQAGSVLGGHCEEVRCGFFAAPIIFLGGTIDDGTTLHCVGGTAATNSNWNLVLENSAVPSRSEGNFIIGQTTETDPASRLFVNGKQRTTEEVIYQDKYEASIMNLMAM